MISLLCFTLVRSLAYELTEYTMFYLEGKLAEIFRSLCGPLIPVRKGSLKLIVSFFFFCICYAISTLISLAILPNASFIVFVLLHI